MSLNSILESTLVGGFVTISQDTPLLKFLLWNAPDGLDRISVDEARNLYFSYERFADLVKPSALEEKLIKRLLYGVPSRKIDVKFEPPHA
jgi:hypothetical protein